MAIDTTAPISRRGLLAAVVGGTAAAIAGTVSRAERVFAAGDDGKNIVIGEKYDDVRSTTKLKMAGPVTRALMVEQKDGGVVIIGDGAG